MVTPGVHVARHVVTCRVAGRAAAAEGVARAARSPEWAEQLAEALAATGLHGYWVIRRVAASAQLGADWSGREMATRLAVAVAQELTRRTGRGSDPEVLWFPDRAAFLATYLVDLAAERTSDRWEYARTVPQGGHALVTLAEREPDELRTAFLALSPVELETVAESLSAPVEKALLAGLATGTAAPAPALLIPALWRLRSAGRLDRPRGQALLLALTACRDDGAPLAAVAGPAENVAGLLGRERPLGPHWALLVADLEGGLWAAAASRTDAEVFLPFVTWESEDRRALARVLRGSPDPAPAAAGSKVTVSGPLGAHAASPDPVPDVLHTSHGGTCLVLAVLEDLWSWTEATRTWPTLDGVPAHRIARLLTVGATLGRGRSTTVLNDPVLRLALGLTDRPDRPDLVGWARSLSSEQVDAFEEVSGCLPPAPDDEVALPLPFGSGPGVDVFARAASVALAALARRLPGMAGASPAYLWRNVLDLPATARIEPNRVVVELGHPPLAILLSISGLGRGDLIVEGGDDRRWTLTSL